MKRLTLLALALPLAACETLNPRPPVDVAQPTAMRPQVVAAPVINNGSIFQATQYRPLFEDHRARLVGDTITVQIVEKIAATQTSTSSIDKSGSVAGSVTALPGLSPNSFTNGRASVGMSSSGRGAGLPRRHVAWREPFLHDFPSLGASATFHGRWLARLVLPDST